MKSPIRRTLETAIKQTNDTFRVLFLSGPRQVGKTTLLQELQKETRSYVTLDDLNERIAAQQDPASFIDRLELPVLIDEVQYAPNLFPYIKIKVDQEKQPGLFWLTGSQQFEMMKNITESLAGRVAILNLQGISLAEEQERSESAPFIPELALLKSRQKQANILSVLEIYHKIWRGSYPDIVVQDGENWERFYASYVSTYIQRDIQDYLNIRDAAAFHKFMQIAAARTGRLINYTDMARDVGVSEVTIKSWLHALEASGIVYQLQPYFKTERNVWLKHPNFILWIQVCALFLQAG